jgi:hypothetical protein
MNRYLQRTGDYAGLPLLPLFLATRATIRCKVAKASWDVQRIGLNLFDFFFFFLTFFVFLFVFTLCGVWDTPVHR